MTLLWISQRLAAWKARAWYPSASGSGDDGLLFPALTHLHDALGHCASRLVAGRLSAMITTIEAVIDETGAVRLLEPVELTHSKRALVTILNEEPAEATLHEATRLSESALAVDWTRPEEDAAWSHLQGAL